METLLTSSQLLCVRKLLLSVLPSPTLYYNTWLNLHNILSSTTQSCTKHFSVVLVLECLRKVLPTATLYYQTCTKYFPVLLCTTKGCTKYFPVLLCTTKVAQNTSQHHLYYKTCTTYFPILLARQNLHIFAKGRFYGQKFLHKASFYAQKLLHTMSFYAEKPLHTASFSPLSFYTLQAFTPRSFDNKFLHKEAFYTQQDRQQAWTHTKAFKRSFYTILHKFKGHVTHESFYGFTRNGTRNYSTAPKPDLGAKAKKKWKESGPKIWQITIATLMQPLQYDLRCHQQVANTHASTQMATQHGNNHAAIPMRSATADSTRP